LDISYEDKVIVGGGYVKTFKRPRYIIGTVRLPLQIAYAAEDDDRDDTSQRFLVAPNVRSRMRGAYAVHTLLTCTRSFCAYVINHIARACMHLSAHM
jgi:hypothetical protein